MNSDDSDFFMRTCSAGKAWSYKYCGPCCLQTGYIDYDKLEEKALDFRPKMLICGGSAYPREWDYKRLYEISRKVGALLMSDMAHIRCARLALVDSILSENNVCGPDVECCLWLGSLQSFFEIQSQRYEHACNGCTKLHRSWQAGYASLLEFVP